MGIVLMTRQFMRNFPVARDAVVPPLHVYKFAYARTREYRVLLVLVSHTLCNSWWIWSRTLYLAVYFWWSVISSLHWYAEGSRNVGALRPFFTRTSSHVHRCPKSFCFGQQYVFIHLGWRHMDKEPCWPTSLHDSQRLPWCSDSARYFKGHSSQEEPSVPQVGPQDEASRDTNPSYPNGRSGVDVCPTGTYQSLLILYD